MGEWVILPNQLSPTPAAAAVAAAQLLQPLALEPAERPQEWPTLPDVESFDADELVETFLPASATANVQPFGGVAPNGVLRGSMVITSGPLLVRRLACMVNQVGVAGNVAMGIYDRAGNLLGTTAQVAVAAAGMLVLPLTAPVTLVQGRRYYLALWTSSNGSGWVGQSGILNTGTGPTICWEITNQTFPLPAGPVSLANRVTATIWVAGLATQTDP